MNNKNTKNRFLCTREYKNAEENYERLYKAICDGTAMAREKY
jgi:hypothetical protein|tara:strand:+ start:350 stop:475 length:126 start_codon:yes stop_codon:yes gene_type:complete